MADRFPKFTDDVEEISNVGDNPGTDANRTADQLKAKSDHAKVHQGVIDGYCQSA